MINLVFYLSYAVTALWISTIDIFNIFLQENIIFQNFHFKIKLIKT